jgi:hypothetical protein
MNKQNAQMNQKFKNAVFCDVALCRSCVNRPGYHEDGGDTFLRNGGSHKIYTALHPRNGILHIHRCENLKYYEKKLFPFH